ncbi:GNAT family N-acetyltransferase [Devosia sp. SD17-2]|uniref:GNAT family N-acetyltransferase n=1 Tax=Devosia sp. SD17-2 TaxID=2976459 RepID=UPI0023D7E97E|nr:GNAT family N-acetyltransferase [Devosia sp. SD17-2]WEJ33560.1 GNAT family N-acetyltransferase [Devosia sp. SD17-2]
MTELRTARLLLRPARPEDAPCYALGIGEYAVARWLTALPWPYTLGMAIEWLRQTTTPRPGQAFFIVEHPQRGVIGSVSLFDEMGFWIARPHWGRGYGREAVQTLVDWHFAQGGTEIIASAQHDNRASLRLTAQLGFRQVTRQYRFSHAMQHNVDHIVSKLERVHWTAGDPRQCA